MIDLLASNDLGLEHLALDGDESCAPYELALSLVQLVRAARIVGELKDQAMKRRASSPLPSTLFRKERVPLVTRQRVRLSRSSPG
jgi:hypothetical protein